MIKKRDRLYNYGKDKSVRVQWFWDPNQKLSLSFKSKKTYKASKFWKPLRSEIDILFLRWNVTIEFLVSHPIHIKNNRSK